MTRLSIGKATISDIEPSARFDTESWFLAQFPVDSSDGSHADDARPRALMSQVHMSRPYAAVGATFVPGSDRLTIRVGHTGPWLSEGDAPDGGLRRVERWIVGLPWRPRPRS